MTKLKEKLKKLVIKSQEYTQVDTLYIAKGGFWTSLSFTINSLLSLVLVIAFANLLPKEVYGNYRYILSIAGSLMAFTLTGMNTAVTRAVAMGYENSLRTAVKTQLKWNLIAIVGAIVGSIYYLTQGNNKFAIAILIAGAIPPLTTAFSTYGAFLGGKKEFKKSAIYSTITTAFHVILLLAILLITKNLFFIIAAFVFSNLIPSIFFYFHVSKKIKNKHSSEEQRKELFKYGGQLSLINVFATLAGQIDKIIVFQFLGPVQLAIYSFALAIPNRIKGLIKNINTLMLPKLSERSLPDIEKIFYKRLIQGLIVGTATSLLYILLAPFLFKLFLPQYLDSIRFSQILSLSLIFIIPSSYVGNVFRSQKMVKTIYISSGTANVLRIVSFIIFGALFGIWGIIISKLAVYLVGITLSVFLWYQEIKKYKSHRV